MIGHATDLGKTVLLAAVAGIVFGFAAATSLAAVWGFYATL